MKKEDDQLVLAEKLNGVVLGVLGQQTLQGFQKAFLLANATQELKTLLTPAYMKPIMELQGNKLGFKTDLDSKGGYKEAVVKNCLIEAVLTGVQPFGNQFNIIASNMYLTKEGFGYLLNNYKGLSYEIIPELPRIGKDNSSAAIVMNIVWTIDGNKSTRAIDFPIRINKFMGTDAVIGKATRKSRAWLYNTITGSELSDGDIVDHDALAVRPQRVAMDKDGVMKDKDARRLIDHISKSTDIKTLEQIKEVPKSKDVQELYNQRLSELKEFYNGEA